MHTPIDQKTTDVEKMIRDFQDRKTSVFRKLSDRIAERLAPSVRTKTSHGEDIAYERLKWSALSPRS